METKENTQPYLPDELIIQIFLRLPVKSLIRFKCVCKLWLSLISDTHFANSHFQITATHTSRILCITHSAPRKIRSIDFGSSPLHHDSSSVSLNPNFMPFQSYYFYIEIKGSCRGFLLLHYYNKMMHLHGQMIYDIYLWNPSTGFHKKIPSSRSVYYSDDKQSYTDCYGFGYDQSTDDYLIVSLFYDDDDDDSYVTMLSRLEFFSLKDNTWKEVEDTHGYYVNSLEDHPRAGLLFNEALHWFGYRHDDLEEVVIVSFDLKERKLLDMDLPDDFYYVRDDCGLWVSGEFLSVWSNYYTVEIWVMKEYNVHSSWTKTIVLPLDAIHGKELIPLCSTKSGDIIGRDRFTGLAKYNDKGQLLEYHSYPNNPRGSQMALYIESLLSLPPDNEQA